MPPSLLLLLLAPVLAAAAEDAPPPVPLVTEANWRELLSGEWMLHFQAPWCAACNEAARSWHAFHRWSTAADEDERRGRLNVAIVDIAAAPGLSGRFLITSLPTVYHVINGEFRQYPGPRDRDDLIDFVQKEKWTILEPLPKWRYPDSVQMSLVSRLFRLSMKVRDLHYHLVEQRGVPPIASYALFTAVTLVLGCLLGYVIVCLIDCVFPTEPPSASSKSKSAAGRKAAAGKASKKASGSNGGAESNGGASADLRQRKKKK